MFIFQSLHNLLVYVFWMIIWMLLVKEGHILNGCVQTTDAIFVLTNLHCQMNVSSQSEHSLTKFKDTYLYAHCHLVCMCTQFYEDINYGNQITVGSKLNNGLTHGTWPLFEGITCKLLIFRNSFIWLQFLTHAIL